ncbi:MAG: ImmA/IrrE family metallo-endopeptidase [Cereibacter sphaeroides]|uniref:ImmA/IrrE family metallo-endopeptidase n=1 Tax=Cereibacter sphaeroides TaxID=1063 RepID=A0A2W5S273_CERSP|nr:MAG: ImmA/IrrE family metallo-endopeptidase [Cereibacter sphaeroides]
MISSQEARAKATELVKDLTAPPVSVERIAKNLGIRIEYAPLDGELSGFAHIRDGASMIGVNSLHAAARQRFTIAHELGHIRLHQTELRAAVHVDKGSLRRDSISSEGSDPLEIQANAFASELLMPQHLLESVLAGKLVDLEDDETIQSLAKRFKVSETAMRYRLQPKG